jgi:hypothetical protein
MNLILEVRCGIYDYNHNTAQVIRGICNLETPETTRRAWPDRTKSDETGLTNNDACHPACIRSECYIQDSRSTKFTHKDRRRLL